MASERMNLKELSAYLKRPADELERMAARDKIPARHLSCLGSVFEVPPEGRL
jgi:hypothetical protein